MTEKWTTMTDHESPKRINPDSRAILWLTVVIAGLLGAASFAVSFAGLTAVAAWAGIPPWMAWTLPMFIDGAIVLYSLAVLVHRVRGENTVASWVSLLFFTLVSVFANGTHAYSINVASAAPVWQMVAGSILAAMAPVAVFSVTEELGRLVLDPTLRVKRRQTRKTVPVTTPASTSVNLDRTASPVASRPTAVASVPAPVRALGDVSDTTVEAFVLDQLATTGRLPAAREVADLVGRDRSWGSRYLKRLAETNTAVAIARGGTQTPTLTVVSGQGS